MKRGLTAVVLGAVFLAGACGGGDDDDDAAASADAPVTTAGADDAASDDAASDDAVSNEAATNEQGAADCSVLTADDTAKYVVYTQVLSQVNDQEQVQVLRDQSFTDYTPEAFAAILVKLHTVLDGHSSDVFGDPQESLDFYDQANEIVGRMIASPDPVPQDLFDEYTALTGGDPTAMISKQLPINATLSELCPEL
jgi:hypothetical protein